MPESQTSAADRVLERLQLRDQLRGGGGAVARVEMRQLRPAAFAREQERGLAFLPLDDLLRTQQIELHGRLIRMQIGNAGPPRSARRCVVQLARRRASSHRAEAARQDTTSGRANRQSAADP